MDYHFKIYTPELKEDWYKVIENSNDAWLFHEPDINAFFGNFNGAENISILLYNKDSQPVAVCPLYKNSIQHKFNRQTVNIAPLNMSGPALINTFGDKKRREVMHLFASEFKRIIAANKCNSFSIATANLAKRHIEAYVNPFLDIWGFSDVVLPYYYLDLRAGEQELLAKMETRTRTILKKLDAANNFEVCIGALQHTEDMIYMEKQTKERFGETVGLSSRTFFEYVLGSLYFKTFVAYINRKPACGIILGVYKNTGFYYRSYTSTEFINTEIGTWLLWHGMKQIKQAGIEHFDLGVNLFSPENHKDVMISKFKRGFGGILRYKFWLQYTNTPTLIAFFRLLKKAIR